MSSDLETVRRIRAWHEGRPLQRGAVLNVHVGADADVLVTAFVRMGGESRPWGIVIGTLADGPRFFTVPEARNRDLVADLMVDVAPVLLHHFRHPRWHPDGPGGFEHASHRQIWLPGPSHVEMLHFLAAAYARTTWQRDDVATLHALGNLCNALFLEFQRPGQQTVVSATEALRQSFVFPTAPVRQGHIGHLLGWLTGGRTRDHRWAAARRAERTSVATVLDPEHERAELQPVVDAWGAARAADDVDAARRHADRVDELLSVALRHRWDLAASAIGALRSDRRRPNARLGELVTDSKQSFFESWGNKTLSETAGEPAWWPNVFTDLDARRASAAYHQRGASADKARFTLVHGDPELQREELAAGRGVIGRVDSVGTERWHLTFTYPSLTTLESGRRLAIGGLPELEFEIVGVDIDEHRIELRPLWKLRKKISPEHRASDDRAWLGRSLVFLPTHPKHLAFKKISHAGRNVEDDITSLLVAPRRRHAAFDDDGPVVEPIEVAP